MQGIFPLLPADTAVLVTTKRHSRVKHVEAVDPDGAGLESARERVDGVDILTKDARGQTKRGVVGALNDLQRERETSVIGNINVHSTASTGE